MTIALILSGLLAAAAVLIVALPYLRDPVPADDTLVSLDEAALGRVALAEERDRALAALKELELDHRAGRISDADYRAVVGPLRREAAEALRALDGQGAGEPSANAGKAAETARDSDGRVAQAARPERRSLSEGWSAPP